MGTNEFKKSLEKSLRKLNFVADYKLKIEEYIVEGEIFIECNCYVKVRFVENWISFSFALIVEDERVWAIDKDNRWGWHRHPLHQVKIHEAIAQMSIEEVVSELQEVWNEIKPQKK